MNVYFLVTQIVQFTMGHWYKGIHGFDAIMQQPNLLCGWIAGSEAQIMESLPEDLLCDICHELLQKFTGDSNIPKPIKITRLLKNDHLLEFVKIFWNF